MEYDRQKAIEYAYEWWNKRNPLFYNFDDIGGDCTNFISQCLFYGGLEMNDAWYYINSYNRSPSWTGVNEFFDYITTAKNYTSPHGKIVSIDEVEPGDIVQLILFGTTYHHNAIITKIVGEKNYDNIFITCHTYDAVDKPLSQYRILKTRFIKIF